MKDTWNKFFSFFKQIQKGFLLLFISTLVACAGAIGGGGLPGGGGVPGGNATPEGEGVEVPMPDTMVYLINEPQVNLAQGGNAIEVRGQTLLNGAPISTKVKVTKKDTEVYAYIESQEDGKFFVTLPADTQKTTEIITLFTVNEENPEIITSSVTEIVLDKLFGMWSGKLSFDPDSLGTECLVEFPRLKDLSGEQEIFVYMPKDFQNQYKIQLWGQMHEVNIDTKGRFSSEGAFSLNNNSLLKPKAQTGCYETYQYQLNGSTDAEIEVDGVYVQSNGEMNIKLTGDNCLSQCEIKAQVDFRRFIPFYYFSQLPTLPEPIEEKLVDDYQVRLERLFQIKFNDGPLQDIIEIDHQSVLALGSEKLYHIQFGPMGQYTMETLFDLNQFEQDQENDLPFKCHRELKELAWDGIHQRIAVTYQDNCGLKSGFFYWQVGDEAPVKQITLPDVLNQSFPYAYSPIFFRNQLLVLGSSWNQGDPESFPENPSTPVIFNYKIFNEHLDTDPFIHELLRAKNPLAMELRNGYELWIMDAAYTEDFNGTAPFNDKFSGFLERHILSEDEEGNLEVISEEVINIFGIDWEDSNQGIPYIRNLTPGGRIVFDPEEDIIVLPSYENYFHSLFGDNKIFFVSLTDFYMMPGNLDWSEPWNQEKWLKSADVVSFWGGFQQIYIGKDFLIILGAQEPYVEGAKLQIMDRRNKNSLQEYVSLNALWQYPIIKNIHWLGRGSYKNRRLLISGGDELYQLKISKKYIDDIILPSKPIDLNLPIKNN